MSKQHVQKARSCLLKAVVDGLHQMCNEQHEAQPLFNLNTNKCALNLSKSALHQKRRRRSLPAFDDARKSERHLGPIACFIVNYQRIFKPLFIISLEKIDGSLLHSSIESTQRKGDPHNYIMSQKLLALFQSYPKFKCLFDSGYRAEERYSSSTIYQQFVHQPQTEFNHNLSKLVEGWSPGWLGLPIVSQCARQNNGSLSRWLRAILALKVLCHCWVSRRITKEAFSLVVCSFRCNAQLNLHRGQTFQQPESFPSPGLLSKGSDLSPKGSTTLKPFNLNRLILLPEP